MSTTSPDWRDGVTTSERFENLQNIKSAIEASNPELAATAQREAFELENQAYRESSTRAQYDEVCTLVQTVAAASTVPSNPESDVRDDDRDEVTIGSYTRCTSVASGVTSEVYKSDIRALKVIVETRNIEPHNPQREAKILQALRRPCIPLLETFRDQQQRFVLVFPYMPLTLADVIDQGAIPPSRIRGYFREIFGALRDIHDQGIIHRDIKPQAILLESLDGPAYLSDFGTAWHPQLSLVSEPADNKILDIGTGPYRAPEVLFGNKVYNNAVDMWAAGAMLAECCRSEPRSLFESRPAHEDGNQLGLILSIFKTLGTPTRDTWPEAAEFKTPPFDMYRAFDGQPWEKILPDVESKFRDLIESLVKYDSHRTTAAEALQHKCLVDEDESTGQDKM